MENIWWMTRLLEDCWYNDFLLQILVVSGHAVKIFQKLHRQILIDIHFIPLFCATGRRGRERPFISQTSSVTEAASDEVEPEQEPDDDVEPARVTQ